jgi:co-chaperonin GroES (HSP10)
MRTSDKKTNITKVNKLTEERFLAESITLDIKVGDVILGGKFKNKKITVKEIGKNDKGDITINGKPLLRFRILDDQDDTK